MRPMHLFSVAAAIQSMGIDLKIIDLRRRPLSLQEVLDRVRAGEFRAIGLTATTHSRFAAISLANLIKKEFPEIHVVAGGIHFSKTAQDALEHVPGIDIVVRGEAEGIARELFPVLLDGGDWSSVKGISFRKGNQIIHNPDAPCITDLDSLPLYTDFRIEDYPETVGMAKADGEHVPSVGIMGSRGCTNRCVFCAATGARFRTRSAQSIVDEMQGWMNRFPSVKGFNFFDLAFTADTNHAAAICNEIISRKLKIRWWAESRLDTDLDLIELMFEAGCRALSVGMESGSPRILETINKQVHPDMLFDFAAKTDSLGMWLDVFFMFSLPSETRDDLKITLRLIQRLLADYKKVLYPGTGGTVTSIFPGAAMEALAKQRGVIPSDFSWNSPYYEPKNLELNSSPYVPIYLEHLSRSDLLAAVRKSVYLIDRKHYGSVGLFKRTVAGMFRRDRTISQKFRAATNRLVAAFRLRT